MAEQAGETFASTLERLRGARGWSGSELARRLGASPSMVSRWLAGKGAPSVQYVQKIAEVFGVDSEPLERLAGYRVSNVADEQTKLDPSQEVEAQEFAAFYQRLLKEIPRPFWKPFRDATEALSVPFAQSTNAPPEGNANDSAHKNGAQRGRPRRERITNSKRPVFGRLQIVSNPDGIRRIYRPQPAYFLDALAVAS